MSKFQLARSSRRFGVGDTTATRLTGPRQITGLRHYFHPSSLGLGLVPSWVDSINGSTFSQATNSLRPTRTTNLGVLFNTHGLQAAVPIIIPSPYSLYIIFGLTVAQGASTYGSIFGTSSSDGFFTLGTRIVRYLGSDNQIATFLPPGEMHDLLYVSTPTSTKTYLDGAHSASNLLADASMTFTYMGFDNASEYYKGYISEIALWPSLLTATDATGLHEYRLGTYPATF